MNFRGVVEKVRELSFSDSLSSLFDNRQIEHLRETIGVMERAVNKVRNWQDVEFQEKDDVTIFFMVDKMLDHLRVSIGLDKKLKAFIRAYLQLNFHYKSCRRMTGGRCPMLRQAINELYGLIESRESAISASLKERMN